METPNSLADVKANPPRVTVIKGAKDDADAVATLALLNHFTQKDGFHCPRCGVVIKNAEEAINHLAEEINNALAHLGK